MAVAKALTAYAALRIAIATAAALVTLSAAGDGHYFWALVFLSTAVLLTTRFHFEIKRR